MRVRSFVSPPRFAIVFLLIAALFSGRAVCAMPAALRTTYPMYNSIWLNVSADLEKQVADSYEPDNTSTNATLLEAGAPSANHSIYPSSDEDWFRFSLSEPATVTLETSGVEGDTIIELFDESLSYFGGDDDGGTEHFSRLSTTLLAGNYFVRVAPYDGTVPDYTLSLELSPPGSFEIDDYEPDNSPAQATILEVDIPNENHSIFPTNDEDWFRFVVTEPRTATLETSVAEGGTLTLLYDENESLLGAGFGGGGDGPSLITKTLPEGVYFVVVVARNGSLSKYALTLRFSGPDDFESDNQPDDATVIKLDTTTLDHSILPAGDEDWFRFVLAEESTISLEAFGSHDTSLIELFDVNVDLIRTNDHGGPAPSRRISIILPTGIYFVRVSLPVDEVGDYALELLSYGPDTHEPDNSPEDATRLIPGIYTPVRRIVPESDEDWFQFDVYSPQTAILDMDTVDEGGVLEIFDDNLNPIADSSFDGSNTYLEINTRLTTGTYFVRVSSVEQRSLITNYYLYLELFEADAFEPDDNPAFATFLSLNEVSSGHSIQPLSDQDWFYFELDDPLNVTIQALGSGLPRLSLVDGATEETLSFEDTSNAEGASLNITLGAGTYYVAVYSLDNYLIPSYDFVVSASPVDEGGPDDFEPDNDAANATMLEAGTPSDAHSIAPSGDRDWFRFELEDFSRVIVEASSTDFNLRFTLYNSERVELRSGGQLILLLPPGEYFVEVETNFAFQIVESYRLTLSVEGAPEPASFRFRRMIPTLQQPWYLSAPNDIDGDADGNLYIIDPFGARVLKLTSDGQYLQGWGTIGENPGQFQLPEYLAVGPEGSVYVADTGNRRIQKFDGRGAFLKQWDQSGAVPSGAFTPSGMDVAPNRNLFVCEKIQSKILIFDPLGETVDSWDVPSPENIAIDSSGTVYVSNANRQEINVLSSDGSLIRTWSLPGVIRGLDITPTGDIGVSISDTLFHGIQFYDNFGNPTRAIEVPNTDLRGNEQVGILPQPSGILIDPLGQLFVANLGVEKYSSDGLLLNDWKNFGSQPGFFALPTNMGVSDDGRVYVLDFLNDRVEVFDQNGRLEAEWRRDRFGFDDQFRLSHLVVQGDQVAIASNVGILLTNLDGDLLQSTTFYVESVEFGLDGKLYGIYGDDLYRFDENLTIDGFWTYYTSSIGEFFGTRLMASDETGNFYISLPGAHKILKINPIGQRLQTWGSFGIEPGQFNLPQGIAVDNDGFVYVSDTLNNRVQRFTSDLVFVDIVLEGGIGPTQVQVPGGIDFDENNTMYIVERGSNRLQYLDAFSVPDNARAIVVAAGGPFPGNELWDTTQFCANFAVRTLGQQGFSNDSIYYLSSDLDLDLDGNGLEDDVDSDATNDNLAAAITQWAAGADSLLLYMVDHGGEGSFRMSGSEILNADALAAWLDQVDAAIDGPITIVYDACQSGSFLDALEGPGRIVVTSSAAEESAYFLSTGTISFSNFFWTEIFNGSSVWDAFDIASQAIGQTIGFQTPQLRDPGNLAATTFLGNATEITGDAPEIVDSTPSGNLVGATSKDLFAEVEDTDGISRAWVVVRPPNFVPPSPDNPVQSLPTVDLFPTEQDGTTWEGTFGGFTSEGDYRLAFYARDRIGNTSQPKQITITVGEPRFRRAVLLGGGAGPDISTESVEASLRIAHQALKSQGYREEDIQFYAPTNFTEGVDGLNVLDNLDFALGDWLGEDTQDLLLYVVGDGHTEQLLLNEGQVLNGDGLGTRLSQAQAAISGVLAVVLDTPRSGSFLPALAAGADVQRIVVASAGADQNICLAPQRSISFSNYFWRRVLNGANVRDAFTHAALAMEFAANGQGAELDDNGDGLYRTATDGLLAQRYAIGSGILLAGDDPLIGSITEGQTLDGEVEATIWAENVTTTGNIDRVFAIVELPASGTSSKMVRCGDRPVEVVELTNSGARYEALYSGFYFEGEYDISVVAVDNDGAASLPLQTAFLQARDVPGPIAPDAFEDDDVPARASNLITGGATQLHNFHDAGDEDWAVLVVGAQQIITLRTLRLGSASDTVLELYAGDGRTLLASNNDRGPSDPASELRHTVTEDGLRFIRVFHASAGSGVGTEYELQVLLEAGTETGGAVIGVVVDSETGDPIVGLSVRLRGLGDNSDINVQQLTLNGGEFVFLQLASGEYELEVSTTSRHRRMDPVPFTISGGAIRQFAFELKRLSSTEADEGHVAVPPAAAFETDILAGVAPLTVQFTDQSSGGDGTITSWFWDFGDVRFGGQQNPSHTYTKPGTYTVSLDIATNVGVGDSTTRTNYITVTAPAEGEGEGEGENGTIVAFEADKVTGTAPLAVQFSDQSTSESDGTITSWQWAFGDGGFSDMQHPRHTYDVSGSYTVSLSIVTSAGGGGVLVKDNFITVTANPGDSVADTLLQNFDDTDTDGDGSLSFSEAAAQIPNLTLAEFNELDTDGNGRLSRVELEANGAEGEGEGEPTPGCMLGKASSTLAATTSKGDTFLFGLTLLTMMGLGMRP